jgi:hypothetical protein
MRNHHLRAGLGAADGGCGGPLISERWEGFCFLDRRIMLAR